LRQGNESYHNGNLPQAVDFYRRCLELQPDHLEAQFNLGVVYTDLEAWDQALLALHKVLDADPFHGEAHNSLGMVFSSQMILDKAQHHFRQATQLRPQWGIPHLNLAMNLLQQGYFREGLAEYEWRWQTPTFKPFQCPHPQWDGRDISQQTLLIHTEQGAGDAIQFVRFVPLAAQHCQRLILFCPENLVELFRTVPGISQICTPGQIVASAFHTYVPLMSLAHLFETTVETIPNQIPYLQAPTNREWIGRMAETSVPQKRGSALGFKSNRPLLRVGIAWAGSPTHSNDRHRSSRLVDWLPILQLPGIRFYSLQKQLQQGSGFTDRRQELLQLMSQRSLQRKLQDLDPYLQSFADTAAAIDQLDLVISVDTAVAHLAGALGKPVWVLLGYRSDWRWLLDRQDSPWYPSMRLFRQQRPGDWAGVITQVKEALEQWQP
jgi:hypothetical protein